MSDYRAYTIEQNEYALNIHMKKGENNLVFKNMTLKESLCVDIAFVILRENTVVEGSITAMKPGLCLIIGSSVKIYGEIIDFDIVSYFDENNEKETNENETNEKTDEKVLSDSSFVVNLN